MQDVECHADLLIEAALKYINCILLTAFWSSCWQLCPTYPKYAWHLVNILLKIVWNSCQEIFDTAHRMVSLWSSCFCACVFYEYCLWSIARGNNYMVSDRVKEQVTRDN